MRANLRLSLWPLPNFSSAVFKKYIYWKHTDTDTVQLISLHGIFTLYCIYSTVLYRTVTLLLTPCIQTDYTITLYRDSATIFLTGKNSFTKYFVFAKKFAKNLGPRSLWLRWHYVRKFELSNFVIEYLCKTNSLVPNVGYLTCGVGQLKRP